MVSISVRMTRQHAAVSRLAAIKADYNTTANEVSFVDRGFGTAGARETQFAIAA